MSVLVARYKPPGVGSLDGYDLDAFAVEYEPDTGALDFRLELGQGLGIFWALPSGPDERLRVMAFGLALWSVMTGRRVIASKVSGSTSTRARIRRSGRSRS